MKAFLFILILLAAPLASAQNVTFSGISDYFCNQLDGTAAGGKCRAPYRKYSGDACEVYDDLNVDYAPLKQWFSEVTNSCSGSKIEEAKSQTLVGRARLRGYVTAGNDETVNDPVENPDFRPNGANQGTGEMYFAAECAIHKCGDSHPQPSETDRDDTGEGEYNPAGKRPTYNPPPPTPDPEPATFVFQVCNQNQPTSIWVAIVKHENGNDWTAEGWWEVQRGQCRDIGTFRRGHFYFFAQTFNTNPIRVFVQSADQRKFCVKNSRFSQPSTTNCAASEQRDFSHVYVNGPRQNWNL